MSPSFSGHRKARVCFIVESGTDVRLVDGMAERFDLTVLARKISDGVEISQPPSRPLKIVMGLPSRAGFARLVLTFLWTRRLDFDHVIVQGYGIAALAANLVGRLRKIRPRCSYAARSKHITGVVRSILWTRIGAFSDAN